MSSARDVRRLRSVSLQKKLVWARYCRERIWNRHDHPPSTDAFDQPEEFDEMNTLLSDILSNAERVSRDGYRYSPETYAFAFDLLRMCGMSALDKVRTEIPLPSWQSLKKYGETQTSLPDLTDWHAVRQRIRDWRHIHGIHHTFQLPCILGVDALCFRPEASVSADGCKGLDLGDAILDDAYIDELLATSTQFLEFVAEHWDRDLAVDRFFIKNANTSTYPFNYPELGLVSIGRGSPLLDSNILAFNRRDVRKIHKEVLIRIEHDR
jgi:hypothetical protein